jgi:outer membrane protein OmpA-like peptidoglycan-associated protein/Tol biopolymer transport system component
MKYLLGICIAAAAFATTACNSTSSLINKADNTAVIKGEYQEAIKLYQQALAKGGDASYINAKIGEAFRKQNKLAEAEPFFREAIAKENATDTVLFGFGQALKAVGKYEEAGAIFSRAASVSQNAELKTRAELEAANAPKIAAMLGEKTDWEITNYANLNTASAEFSPVIFQKDLYFTSNRDNKNTYKADGQTFYDLYSMKLEGKGSGKLSPLDAIVNLPGFMKASSTFSKDGKMMVFAMSNEGNKKGRANVDIFVSRKKSGKWSAPELLNISHPGAWDSSPAFSPDGKSLYFSSDRPGGFGAADIYRASIDDKGKFTKVTNMGDKINTPGEEMYPYVSDEGKLYFSSDGHPGFGNLDIFVASRGEDKSITIVNMGSPVNSAADDFGIYLKAPLDGYISSNRAGGKGSDDIYIIRNTSKDVKTVKFVLIGKSFEAKGTDTTILANTVVRLIDDNSSTLGEVTTDSAGNYTFELSANSNYVLIAAKAEHLTKREEYTTNGKSPAQDELKDKENTITLEKNMYLEPIKKNQIFALENVYYEFNKWDITDSAAVELDKLVVILKDNPTIEIELGSHTDSRGNKDYNKTLSEKRAQSAVEYIVRNGIETKRIVAKGYGFDNPLIVNAVTEEDHQKNRRTEFKVTKINQQ